jgi:hypothetical protein
MSIGYQPGKTPRSTNYGSVLVTLGPTVGHRYVEVTATTATGTSGSRPDRYRPTGRSSRSIRSAGRPLHRHLLGQHLAAAGDGHHQRIAITLMGTANINRWTGRGRVGGVLRVARDGSSFSFSWMRHRSGARSAEVSANAPPQRQAVSVCSRRISVSNADQCDTLWLKLRDGRTDEFSWWSVSSVASLLAW